LKGYNNLAIPFLYLAVKFRTEREGYKNNEEEEDEIREDTIYNTIEKYRII
jgi:hypothetical protein